MRNLIKKVLNFYHSGNIAFYVSLIAPFVMGTIHLISSIVRFDWITINYCVFSYLFVFFKIWQWSIEKFRLKPNSFIAGLISIIILLAPMMASFILTIQFKEAPNYIFEWLIYAYALYGTIKIIFASKGISKKNKTPRQYVLAYFGFISALYTMQMMEFRLIKFFDTGSADGIMYILQLCTQGAIFLFCLFVIILFIYKAIKERKESQIEISTNE